MDSRKLITEQVAYYRARAAEYDETAYGGGDCLDEASVAGLVADLKPHGDVLGAGLRNRDVTQHLTQHVAT
jgi:hypothetical protein